MVILEVWRVLMGMVRRRRDVEVDTYHISDAFICCAFVSQYLHSTCLSLELQGSVFELVHVSTYNKYEAIRAYSKDGKLRDR